MPTPDPTPSDNPGSDPQPSTHVAEVNWGDHIPAEYKESPMWEKFRGKPLGEVLKSHAELESQRGTMLPVPEPGDTEGWGKVYAKLGRPDESTGYTAELPKLDGVEWNAEAVGAFKQVAHSVGMNDTQLKTVFDGFGQIIAGDQQRLIREDARRAAETQEVLKNEYGINYDLYLNYAKRAGAEYFGAQGEELVDRAMSTSEPVLRGMIKLGRELAEDGFFGDDPQGFAGMGKQAAQQEIDAMFADPKGPYRNAAHPEHDKAIERSKQLFTVLSS